LDVLLAEVAERFGLLSAADAPSVAN
jgi:hypothetical protein